MKVGCISAALAFLAARLLFALINLGQSGHSFVDKWIELILIFAVALPCFVIGFVSGKRREAERERERQAKEEKEKKRTRTL